MGILAHCTHTTEARIIQTNELHKHVEEHTQNQDILAYEAFLFSRIIMIQIL
jgi:hypothetical protein